MGGSNNGSMNSESVNVVLGRQEAYTLDNSLAGALKNPPSQSVWQRTNAPQASSRTDDIWFPDPDTGWLCNSSGFVCKTEDGGETWKPQFFLPPNLTINGVGISPYLRTIEFANHDVGWFGALTSGAGDYYKVLLHHTRDGGETWSPVDNLPADTPPGICGLAVVNEHVVYGAGTNDPNVNKGGPLQAPGVIKTTDGGANWELITGERLGSPDNLIDIHFFDEQYGYVVGGKYADSCPAYKLGYDAYPQYARLKPVVLRTRDGGATWTNVIEKLTDSLPCGSWGWKFFWLENNPRVIFVSVENFTDGLILKSLDGGDSWTHHPINDRRLNGGSITANADLEGIGFIDENTGWVGGWGNTEFIGDYNSFTRDGGLTWEAQDYVPSASSSDVRRSVNRYRFFDLGDRLIGYCSGESVYKLVFKHGQDSIDASPLLTSRRPHQIGGKTPVAALTESGTPAVGAAQDIPALGLRCASGDRRGTVEVTYWVPEGTRAAYVGVWSHFGWHVCTLADEADPKPGLRTLTWDGKNALGEPLHGHTHIFRAACDGVGESYNFHLAR